VHRRPRGRRRLLLTAVITAAVSSALAAPQLISVAGASPQPPHPKLVSPPRPPAAEKVRTQGRRHELNRFATLQSPPKPPLGIPQQPKAAAGGSSKRHGTTSNGAAANGTAPNSTAPNSTTPNSATPNSTTPNSTTPNSTTITDTASTGTTSTAKVATTLVAAAAVTPPTAKTFGPTGPTKTLVLYDSTGTFGWLGELYALAGGTLATHFGQVTAEPVTSYVAGQVNDYTATLYFGSTYNEAIPAAFLSDAQTTTKPVIWSGFNVWQLSGAAGSATATAFQAKYGWDPSTSYLDGTDSLLSVAYKGQSLTRNALNTGGVLSPHITNAALVSVLAQANCTTAAGVTVNCTGIAQTTGSTLPWAIRSSNLTYVGEIPFSYLSERDRYLVYSDLLFPAEAPATVATKKAAVRLEDVSPVSDPVVLKQFADYLSSQGVPFQVAVIPQYTDPKGTFNGGVAQTITLAQAPAVVTALQYMQKKGGTIIQHGYTHQYSNVANPYNGVSADDFEFFRSECSSTQNAPYSFGACTDASWVILEGPLPTDSASWAANRVTTGRNLIKNAGLGTPTIFETPHYTASVAAYQGMRQVYGTRYERELFFGGLLKPGNSATNRFGQFFPYSVTDVYGSKVLPENLGNYEPIVYNNNPPRLAQDIVNNAAANQVVTQSTASLFFHPDYPLTELQKVVTGIKGLGFGFVQAGSLS